MNELLRRVRDLLKGTGEKIQIEEGMKLIVGLGNPGSLYENNRHNIGFQCVERFAQAHGLEFRRRQGQAYVAMGRVGSQPVVLAKPQTFMNRSGQAVGALSRFYKVPPRDILIVYDDLDIPLGKIRIRERGSAGGHNGMRSVIASLGTDEMARLRLGIGRPSDHAPQPSHQEPGRSDVMKHVLSDFSAAERPVAAEMCERAAEAIDTILAQGVVAAMNKYNAS